MLFRSKEDKGPFDSSALQLFMPSISQCNGRKCSIEHFKSNMPREVNSSRMASKPDGGLWTATARKVREGVYSSPWSEWVQTDMPEWFNEQGILIEPKSDNVFHIETDEDADQLAEMFPKEEGDSKLSRYGFSSGPSIDWKKALSDEGFDGIHWGMKSGGQSDSYFGYDAAWDVESTCWRSDAVQKGIIEPVKIVQISKNI